MLSTGAFNALLKTREEPPGHVKFIMATTEPQKVPATILSRVQRFEFRSIGADTVADRLRYILKEEGITAEDEVVRRVARLANGSMRDALSVLDQLLSLGSDSLTGELIDSVLPASYDEILSGLIDRVAGNDAAGTLGALDDYVSRGNTLERFCDGLIDHFRTLMLLNVCGADTDLVDVPVAVREAAVGQSQQFDGPTYVYFITLLEELRRNVRFSGSGRALADAAMVKLAEAEQFSSLSALLSGAGVSAGDQKKKGESVTKRGDPEGSAAAAKTAEPARTPAVDAPKRDVESAPTGRTIAPSVGRADGESVRTSSEGEPAIQPAKEKPVSSPAKSAETRLVGKLAAGLSQEERRKAMADKLVREAMNLFDGTVVNVERQGVAELPEDPME
jgi:DNA polymerase-3 subunit gamma/tau